MPVKAQCPGCGKQVSAPDKALGRKAKCPDCGQIIEFRADASPGPADGAARAEQALASLVKGGSAVAAAGALEPESPPADSAGGSAAAAAVAAAPTPATPSTKTSVTTIDRLIARTSPYRSMRLMGAIGFAAGVGLAVVCFIGGLATLVLVAMAGQPWLGVAIFVATLVLAALVFLGSKMLGDLVRLAADVGDETRRNTQMLEELRNHRGNGEA